MRLGTYFSRQYVLCTANIENKCPSWLKGLIRLGHSEYSMLPSANNRINREAVKGNSRGGRWKYKGLSDGL